MDKISATKVLFIKLGDGGRWEEECIKTKQCLKLGFNSANHEDCLAGNWDKIKNNFIETGKKAGTPKDFVRQVQEFYTADDSVLWITFHANKMWWCFAKDGIELLPDKTKERKVKGKWSDMDLKGSVLTTDKLSGKLLKTQGYRGTICNVVENEYVINKINGEDLPEVNDAKQTLIKLEDNLEKLIKHLGWSDFELLVDLIFTNAGWQRVGRLGKQEKTLDLDLVSPVTNEKVMVQIKSQSSINEFTKYKSEYSNLTGYKQMFYVVNNLDEKLMNVKNEEENIKILGSYDIAKLAISAGLANWIIEKAS